MKLGLGTVQFGLNYGISNTDGQIDDHAVYDILTQAHHAGIKTIDTAALYGTSEEVLGRTMHGLSDLKIVTKTPFFASNVITQTEADLLIATFQSSLQKLGKQSIYGLLLHNPHDMYKKGFELIWHAMQELKHHKLVQKVGFSVYTSQQIDYILEHYLPDLVQLPINVFDQRLLHNKYLEKLKKVDVEIHARSVFLQGLLLMQPNQVPTGLSSVKTHIQKYHEQTLRQGLSPLEASLQFVLTRSEIDCVLAGVCSPEQLGQIIAATKKVHNLDFNFAPFALHDEKILNPALWSL